ncbi:MAG TPA: DUF3887 domain-containing protein [Candidatus Hydrogenedentes bacterium]|nr:DUF3887 domain-containing protein [Candidatus Hydrogenedentota bacterium]HOS02101.1 DUF3887 domain-containing protein [Candidatus Hydrogenedentota bacterium]
MDKKLVAIVVVLAVIAIAPLLMYAAKQGPAPSAMSETVGANVIAIGQEVATALTQNDFAAAYGRFDERMRAALPEAKLAEVWQGLLKEVGAFQKQAGIRHEKIQGFDVVFVTCEFERGKRDLQVTVGPSGQVAGLYYRLAK